MKKLKEEVNRMIGVLRLEAKRDVYSSRLSGGMKRKLSVGIALISGSKVGSWLMKILSDMSAIIIVFGPLSFLFLHVKKRKTVTKFIGIIIVLLRGRSSRPHCGVCPSVRLSVCLSRTVY